MLEPSSNLKSILAIALVIIINKGAMAQLCATLFREVSQAGEKYSMADDSHVTDFDQQHITVDSVWNSTLSFNIENGCKLTACNDSHFLGNCMEFSESLDKLPDGFDNVLSASCFCSRTCSCSDVRMRRSSCARAFLGGCDVCNPQYTDLKGEKPDFPAEFSDVVKAIKVRDGCEVSIFSESHFDGNETNVFGLTEWDGPIGSYNCSCSREPLQLEKPPHPSTYPALIDVPTSIENVSLMLAGEYKDHPGLLAALKSLKNKRSSRNVYILTIGSTGSGKSSAINLLFDNPNITKVGTGESVTTDIHEFRVNVPVDEWGIGNSELRVIDTPGLGDTRGLQQDAKYLATLDDYLANHEELHDRIPNVVLIFHKFHDNRFAGDGSIFVKMLRGFDAFRSRITDENNSNVIFVLSHFMSERPSVTKKPKEKLQHFKNVIEEYSLFPKPIIIAVAENMASEEPIPSVNGYFKLPNGDYYPRNIFEKIQSVASAGGDPIGDAVITQAFRNSDDFNITSLTYKLVEGMNNKVSKYYNILAGVIFNVEATEVSKLLATAYEEMDSDIKAKYPGSLIFLQKALNVRNIRAKADVPQTKLATLDLLAHLKLNKAIAFLLENGLNLKAPYFNDPVLTGYSYNVFKDTPLQKSPFNVGETISSEIGYLLPSAMTCSVRNQVSDFLKIFPNRTEYLNEILSSVGIQGGMKESKFLGEIRPGFNIEEESFLNDSCQMTAVREIRTFELVLNDRPQLSEEFTALLHKLPVYNESDPENVNIWNGAFSQYGSHVVKSVYGGGAITIQLKSNKACGPEIKESLLDFIKFAEDLFILGDNSSHLLKQNGVEHILTFRGGDQAYHVSDLTKMSLDDASRTLSNWKKSIRLNPTILTSEIELLPLSVVVKKARMNNNISSEIERVTNILFNRTLIHSPPKNPLQNQPGPDRSDSAFGSAGGFSDVFRALVAQNEATSKRFEMLILVMQKDRKESDERRDKFWKEEMERQREREDQRREEMKRDRKELDESHKKLIDEIRKENERRRQIEKEEQKIRESIRISAEERAKQEAAAKAAREAREKAEEEKTSCLRKGTPILLADKTTKPVETIQVGDILLDHELQPTTVIGISYEFLRTQTFYGFDNESFFFTDSHMLVGPGENQGIQIYGKSLEVLYGENPLMEFMNVREMDEFQTIPMFAWQKSNSSLVSRNVRVFKDPVIYPEDTLIYFLQVDSSSGTYFANGYVCRHEIPPIHIWPNTMALLFHLYSIHPLFKLFENVPYTFEISSTIKLIALEVETDIRDTLKLLENGDVRMLNLTINEPRLDFENVDINLAIDGVFNHPTAGALAMTIYGRTSKMIAHYLDTTTNISILEPYMGNVQKLISDALAKQITASFQKYLPELQ